MLALRRKNGRKEKNWWAAEGTKSSPPWFKWIVQSAYVTEAKVVNSQFLTLAFSHWSHAPQWWCGWYWINSAKNSTPYWDTMKMFKMLSNCTEDTRNGISEKNENASIWKNVKVWNRVEMISLKWDDNSKPNKLSLSLWFWYFVLSRTLILWKFFAVLKNGKGHTFTSMWNTILCLFIMVYIPALHKGSRSVLL